jgi:hypothetical protein
MEKPTVPDLARSSVLTWLGLQEPGKPDLLENPVTAVEAHPDVEAALVGLGEALDAALARDPAGLAAGLGSDPNRADLRAVLGQLGLPRALRLIGWIMQSGLPDANVVLGAVLAPDSAGNGQYLQAMLSRCVRPPLLERLYAQDRLTALLAACEPMHGRPGAA